LRSGFVTILGRPNVGKSTLLNCLLGEKVVIMSEKPQTTRNSIRCILTEEDCQIVFLDTPGVHKPKNKLGEFMMDRATKALEDVDAVVLMMEATEKPGPGDRHLFEMAQKSGAPILLIVNKIDAAGEKLAENLAGYDALGEEFGIEKRYTLSALTGEGTQELLKDLKDRMPDGPFYFPDDMIIDEPERTVVEEFIREQILKLTYDEVPHGVAVETDLFQEWENGLVYISATIYTEKKSHKSIIIGKNGALLKKIGMEARKEIEGLLGTKVFLELWVKVREDWRNSKFALKEFGYRKEE